MSLPDPLLAEAPPPVTRRGPLVVVIVLIVALVAALAAVMVFVPHRPVAAGPVVTRPSALPGTDPGVGDTRDGGQGAAVDGIPCTGAEQFVSHTHAHLFILQDGVAQPVAAYVGIALGSTGVRCFYELHTHDRSGIIHLEAPRARTFTLGQFFDIWGQPLTSNQVARLRVPGARMAVFVDGKRHGGDPRGIALEAHTRVVIELGREVPPPTYSLQGF